jgi:hypothetical protein
VRKIHGGGNYVSKYGSTAQPTQKEKSEKESTMNKLIHCFYHGKFSRSTYSRGHKNRGSDKIDHHIQIYETITTQNTERSKIKWK